jgi:Uncharacterized protein conserved in bacteria (DUF2213)
MATAYYASRISPNQFETPTEGYRICRSVRICRTGYQDYLGTELKKHPSYDPAWNLEDDRTYKVFRPLDEVTSAATIASFDGKSIVDEHPPAHMAPGSLVTIDNERDLTCGHMQNVRVGPALGTGEVPLIADLHVKDGDLIDKIDAGIRDVSCGYTYTLKRLANGTFIQTNIRGNHIAVVPQGRAGADISIQDSAVADSAPQLEELIEDEDPEEKAWESSHSVDAFIAQLEDLDGGRSAAVDRGCLDGAPRGLPATAAVDRAISHRPFDGVPYSQGKAAYDSLLATDASAPELPASHFYAGVPFQVGKVRHEAYLQTRQRHFRL